MAVSHEQISAPVYASVSVSALASVPERNMAERADGGTRHLPSMNQPTSVAWQAGQLG